MQRWVEQVECIAMLEQVNWLDQIPDTTDNVEALKVIFREGMK